MRPRDRAKAQFELEPLERRQLLTADLPSLSIVTFGPVPEGNAGTTPLTLHVFLSQASQQTITVQYATSDGAAKAGADYLATSGTLTFAAGQTDATFSVQVIGNTIDQPDLGFYATISNPTNATIAVDRVRAVIQDDDGPSGSGYRDPVWRLGAFADYNHDGHPDAVWNNTATGENQIELFEGVHHLAYASLPTTRTSWRLCAATDLDSDGSSDLLWRNTSTGANVVWLMKGTNIWHQVPLEPTRRLSWQLVGAADFTGDSKPDILWRDLTTGENLIWRMNGVVLVSQAKLASASLAWSVGAVADFSGDGKADILWFRARSGENVAWVMLGTTRTSQQQVTPISVRNPGWQPAGAADLLGSDNMPDLVWRNYVTGETQVWRMDHFTGVATSERYLAQG